MVKTNEEIKETKPKTSTSKSKKTIKTVNKSSSSKTTKKDSTKKNTTSKSKNTNSTTTKKTSTKSSSAKKNTANKNTSKKTSTKSTNVETKNNNINKELEKTLVIENIEHEIDKIVENKDKIEEQVIEKINDVKIAKLEDAKFNTSKRNKKLLAIGVIVSLLGIIALIISLIANRIIDKEFISDTSIALMIIASILIECFGAFIIINEV